MIKNFKKIRRDGKVILEGMDGKSMSDLGWKPSKVIRFEWIDGDNNPVSVINASGLLGEISPDRKFIAIIKNDKLMSGGRLLEILDEFGEVKVRFSKTDFFGRVVPRWFEKSNSGLNSFLIVVEPISDNVLYQLEVEFDTGKVLNKRAVR